jgi:cell division protein FtsB
MSDNAAQQRQHQQLQADRAAVEARLNRLIDEDSDPMGATWAKVLQST